MSLPTAILRAAIKKVAAEYHWDWRVLEAHVMVESTGRPMAFRYEPAKQDGSFGLLQVMGNTARNLGLPQGTAEASLCDPYVGLDYGMKALKDIVRWRKAEDLWAQGAFKSVNVPFPPKLREVLAVFNGGGVGNPREDGTLRNESYVQRVETFFQAVVQETA